VLHMINVSDEAATDLRNYK